MNTKVAKKKNNKGFTLIELIVVIAIIAVLAAILAPQYLRYVEKSRISSDESTANEIKNATNTACAEESVYDYLAAAATEPVVTWGENGVQVDGTKIATGDPTDAATALSNELAQTISTSDQEKKPKSKKYNGKDYTINITIEDSGTVNVVGSWPDAAK